MPDSRFKVGDVIIPYVFVGRIKDNVNLEREVLDVGDTFYTVKELAGEQLVSKQPIAEIDTEYRLHAMQDADCPFTVDDQCTHEDASDTETLCYTDECPLVK